MFAMDFDITLGNYWLTAVEKVTVKRSVENLADTAQIVLPATENNRALQVEEQLSEGDPVMIRFGYNADQGELPIEFEGYIESIATDDGSIRINCEDEIYRFRRDLRDAVLTSVTVQSLLEHVAAELGGFAVACDYEFRYDQFTIHQATGYDVLKKVQEDTRANIYLKGKTLHVHRSIPNWASGSSMISPRTSKSPHSSTEMPGSESSRQSWKVRTLPERRSRSSRARRAGISSPSRYPACRTWQRWRNEPRRK